MRRAFDRRAAVALISLSFALTTQAQFAERNDSADHSVVAVYSTSSGSPEASSKPKLECGDLVGYVWGIVPTGLRDRVVQLSFFKVKASAEDAADGIADTDDDGNWQLSFDYDMGKATVAGNREKAAEFDAVLVHELGHVISLSWDQEAEEGTGASAYSVDDVAYRDDSYISAFYLKFWKNKYPGWKPHADDDAEATSALYEAHADSFVTEYAATDPAEDFAESYAFFVQGSKPTATDVKAKKLLFFYAYPELVQFRDSMRKGMKSAK